MVSARVGTPPPVAEVHAPVATRHNPALAGALSFLWCGAGQIYSGHVVKGTVLVIAYFSAWIAALAGVGPSVLIVALLWTGGIVDAYVGARPRRPRPDMTSAARADRAAARTLPAPSVLPIAALMPHAEPHRRRYFRTVLAIGIASFALLTVATAATGSALAVILVLAVGSFLVPIVYVEYIDELDLFAGVPRPTLVRVALLTAVVAVPMALVLERVVLAGAAGGLLPALGVGLIEEAVKLIVVLRLVRHTRFHFVLDGVIIGAAAGMGFAGFEDSMYALTNLSQHGIPGFLSVLWLRQVLGPFGHGTWTAIVGAALWKEHFGGRRLLDRRVVLAFLAAALLHGAWDWNVLPGYLGFAWTLGVGVVSLLLLRWQVGLALAEERAQMVTDASTATHPVALAAAD